MYFIKNENIIIKNIININAKSLILLFDIKNIVYKAFFSNKNLIIHIFKTFLIINLIYT